MISSNLSLIKRAANTSNKSDFPDSSKLVETLLALEKAAKKEKSKHDFLDLVGTWNLRFITGTKKTRNRAGIVLGAGRYIPQLIKIQITYDRNSQSIPNTGRVKNSVRLAGLNLSLTGPVKFIPQKNILAFDFTAMTVSIFGIKIYDGYVGKGKTRDREFYQMKISQQAFFSYFLIQEKFIAARGKGGGLALWSRDAEK